MKKRERVTRCKDSLNMEMGTFGTSGFGPLLAEHLICILML